MSWADADSRWSRAVRKFALFWLGSAAFGAVMCVMTGSMVPEVLAGPLDGSVIGIVATALVVIGTLVMLGFVLYCVREARRMFRIRRLVPANDGLFCRKCNIVVPVVDDRAKCAKHGDLGSPVELRSTWEQMFFVSRRVSQEEANERLSKPVMRLMKFGLPIASGLVILTALVASYFIFGIPGLVKATGFALFMIGMMILPARNMVGTSSYLACAECGYRKDDSDIPRCPECSAPWNEPGRTVKTGEAAPPARLRLWIGVAVLVLGVVWCAATWGGRVTRWMPTSVLIDRTVAWGGIIDDKAFATAVSRDLSRAECDRLANLVLDARDRWKILPPGQVPWLREQLDGMTLAPATLERIHGFAVQLYVPVAPTDEPNDLTVATRFYETLPRRYAYRVTSIVGSEGEVAFDGAWRLMAPDIPAGAPAERVQDVSLRLATVGDDDARPLVATLEITYLGRDETLDDADATAAEWSMTAELTFP